MSLPVHLKYSRCTYARNTQLHSLALYGGFKHLCYEPKFELLVSCYWYERSSLIGVYLSPMHNASYSSLPLTQPAIGGAGQHAQSL